MEHKMAYAIQLCKDKIANYETMAKYAINESVKEYCKKSIEIEKKKLEILTK